MQDEMVAVGRDGLKRIAVRALVVLAVFGLVALASEPAFAHDTVYYFMTDALHSTVVVTDQNRNIVEETHYGPYGLVLNRQLRDGPGYGGHEEDSATGLVYMQQRYYDPQAGRFISTDPVQTTADGGNFNRYGYAKDNPYRYTDPDGRQVVVVVGACAADPACDALVVAGGAVVAVAAKKAGNAAANYYDHVMQSRQKKAKNASSQAGDNRAKNKAKGVPNSQIGPSGKPKIHTVDHGGKRSEAKEAARRAVGKGGSTVKHTSPNVGKDHYHGVTQSGKKIHVHHEYDH